MQLAIMHANFHLYRVNLRKTPEKLTNKVVKWLYRFLLFDLGETAKYRISIKYSVLKLLCNR